MLSACFALVMVLGPCFVRGNSWEQARSAPVQSILSFLSFLCYLAPCFVLLREAGRFFFSGRAAGEQAVSDKPALKSFFFMWGLLILFWMPYLISFYPGIANSDVPDQLAMSFNMEKGSYALIPCFPLYGINIVKNSSYSAWVYLCVILMLRLADRGGGRGFPEAKAFLPCFPSRF